MRIATPICLESGWPWPGTWAVGDWSMGWKHRRAVLGGLMAAVIGALMVCAWKQTAYWKNSETLWTHTLACTTGNYVAHYNLGAALPKKEEWTKRLTHYQKALQINPDNAEAHYNLGTALLQKGKVDEAISHFQQALEIKPDNAEAHYNLGNALRQKGNVNEAITHYQEALQINPDYAEAHVNLGIALVQKGRVDEAITHFQKALEINARRRGCPLQPRNRSSTKGKSGRSDRSIPRGAANQP